MAFAESTASIESAMTPRNRALLFWACFISLIATAFGFIVRTQVITQWGVEFGLDETQKGKILGAGLWPYAISIVFFSLIIDKIGYRRAMIFAFAGHVGSTVILCMATNYQMLYWGTFLLALASGTVETVINPAVATVYPREKTKWMNILHAAWPGGIVLGGVIGIWLGETSPWEFKIGLVLVPTAIYGILMLFARFPVSERVAAGVSYRDMLKEPGILGALIVVFLIVRQLGTEFGLNNVMQGVLIAVLVGAFGVYVRGALGRPMYVFLILIMIPLATTELGTDSWIKDLMRRAMTDLSINPAWLLVHTSLIMVVLRCFSGPIVRLLTPLGLLAVSCAIATLGLVMLSNAAMSMVLVAATVYGVGKTFCWPTMLGVVAERFPRGGALTLNLIAAVGMLGVGTVGTVLIGTIQDTRIVERVRTETPQLAEQVIAPDERASFFVSYQAIDKAKVEALPEAERAQVNGIVEQVKHKMLATVAILPAIEFVCFVMLILYFRSRGGYKAEELLSHNVDGRKYGGGVAGPAEP